jgi:uncharacterized membrane protein
MFITALVVYAVLEAAWLWTMRSFYDAMLGPVMRGRLRLRSIPAVVMVYALLVVALVFFVLRPARHEPLRNAMFRGALFGASVYGVYNLTNMATLEGYSWTMVGVDTLWGSALFAIVAALATYV